MQNLSIVRLVLLPFNQRSCLMTPLYVSALLITATSLYAAKNIVSLNRTPTGGVDIKIDGKPFACYVIDRANKPYLWPIYGPTGKQMTRAYPMLDVPQEDKVQRDHPHHRGLSFGSESIGLVPWPSEMKWDKIPGGEAFTGGGDTWHEPFTFEQLLRNPKTEINGRRRMAALGSIKHREFTEMKAEGGDAVVAEKLDYLDHAGKRYLSEERRMRFHVVGEMWAIDFDQEFIAEDGAVCFNDRKDAGLYIRVPATMAVDSKLGGKIINSNGLTNNEAWGRPAEWCDYNGPVGGEHLGIAILSHPSSFRYPTAWHVRSYGLFAANPFAVHQYDKDKPSGDYEMKSGEKLKLRHRFLFHRGDEKAANIAEAFRDYIQ
jgi:hypothetical protein